MPHGIEAPGPYDLPGDIKGLENEGLAEGESVWIRMAVIIRTRRLDVRLLLDQGDKYNRGL